mmetsp:Transcript_21912/g.21097  ORF Transcript_21912/g.21097 Transcript_21912/m.21097 type:complete len:81 (-) Transcript_21912:413-655(-)
MMRRLFEKATGIITGTDMQAFAVQQYQLICSGFKGEGIVDNRIWISKTHFPYTIPVSIPQVGNVALVLVRNPIDCIVSYL